VPDVPTVASRPGAHRIFLKKAQEFARAMERAFEVGDYNAAASAASHCAISACDALLARHKGLRSRARDHGAVVRLIETIGLEGAEQRANQLERVLSVKQFAEYDDRDVRKADAAEAVKRAKRFLDWAAPLVEG
jgi:HEPN domain-containing protein